MADHASEPVYDNVASADAVSRPIQVEAFPEHCKAMMQDEKWANKFMVSVAMLSLCYDALCYVIYYIMSCQLSCHMIHVMLYCIGNPIWKEGTMHNM